MKKLQIMTAVLILLAVAGCRCPWCRCGKKETAESIVAKMEKAVDVSNRKHKITSARFVYDSGLGDKNRSRVTLKLKAKDQIRLEINLKNSIMVKAYNGNIAWQYTTAKGLSRLNDEELNALRFQASYLTPDLNYNKLFSKLELKGEKEAAGQKCWELVCSPRPEFRQKPVITFVDKKNYFVVKTVENYIEGKKEVEMTTYFGKYENIDGIMVPRLMIFQKHDQILETELVSAEWNVELPDSDFDMPRKFSAAK
ncbi:MAG: outer membrane lipoprotein-sorting protein [Victivallaceae bacterium]|nr:outer membrane lipoprotein-sorting protein [Victivallaceae bacterium]